MLQSVNAPYAAELPAMRGRLSSLPPSEHAALVQRVANVASALGCHGVWARPTGPYILLGLRNGDAFARLTALGGSSYGLAFRADNKGKRFAAETWEPVLLVDELAEAIEHALIGIGATSAA
jgi:hypothetical protein